MKTTDISIVVPVFGDGFSLSKLLDEVSETFLTEQTWELIFVDDGSSDRCWNLILELCHGDDKVRGLRLGNNFGQHSATLAGLREALGNLVITLDDDLQNPPKEIPRLIEYLESNNLDLVYGTPERYAHHRFRVILSQGLRKLMAASLGAKEFRDVSSFRAMRRQLVSSIQDLPGGNINIDALFSWSSFRIGTLQVEHRQRATGSSRYSPLRLVRHALDAVASYSVWPLRLASLLGLAMSIGAFAYLVLRTVIEHGEGIGISTVSVAIPLVVLLAGIQLLALGVMGEYLARIHLRSLNRITYWVRETSLHRTNGDDC